VAEKVVGILLALIYGATQSMEKNVNIKTDKKIGLKKNTVKTLTTQTGIKAGASLGTWFCCPISRTLPTTCDMGATCGS
jgi:hypothetical protein